MMGYDDTAVRRLLFFAALLLSRFLWLLLTIAAAEQRDRQQNAESRKWLSLSSRSPPAVCCSGLIALFITLSFEPAAAKQ